MSKKFFTNKFVLYPILIFTSLATLCTILYIMLDDLRLTAREILPIFAIFFCACAVVLLLTLLFNCWVVEVNDQGILYRNLFKFRKFTRFFRWDEIDEIEMIKIRFFPIKSTYITKQYLTFGQKIYFAQYMKNEPNIIVLNIAHKKLQNVIQQYYQKQIIFGRTFKIAIAQEDQNQDD